MGILMAYTPFTIADILGDELLDLFKTLDVAPKQPKPSKPQAARGEKRCGSTSHTCQSTAQTVIFSPLTASFIHSSPASLSAYLSSTNYALQSPTLNKLLAL
ncbi:uncharacterized protein LACBIDRAFT_322376 [Laccaria bicolor S238N-H82]|uniref:Predicted protein n=1 Tax=Laccaria bicolor (strain S238N-H82 / ATCC MYA-4686) TaxID=486041 RepID=B0CT82_LACBS|nr:uncharacterized protein LACBIDRAFT_322376 [Laccaria bicolor S238N-H82]EDR14415.1 predicted protein [Laccaria bicolor S238N-H82]|eukprot:XP_001874974.1 predicted protein [Laccaria bicolor S238N-H82]